MRHCKAGAGAKRRQIQDKREDDVFVQLAASHEGLLEALEVQREHHGREKDEKLFGCVGVHRLLVVFLIIFFPFPKKSKGCFNKYKLCKPVKL